MRKSHKQRYGRHGISGYRNEAKEWNCSATSIDSRQMWLRECCTRASHAAYTTAAALPGRYHDTAAAADRLPEVTFVAAIADGNTRRQLQHHAQKVINRRRLTGALLLCWSHATIVQKTETKPRCVRLARCPRRHADGTMTSNAAETLRRNKLIFSSALWRQGARTRCHGPFYASTKRGG